jgi:hypothetical protein
MARSVAFLVFNRPESTARVFERIRGARPSRLFVVADGPRADKPGDVAKCEAVRHIVDQGIDWPCEVHKKYAERNLGCARGVAGGLTWAFSFSEKLIVLEDDCLPDPGFFDFCDELLDRYATDTRIGHITGCLRYFQRFEMEHSYAFCRYGSIWGWASWSRAWRHYDLEMRLWPQFLRQHAIRSATRSRREEATWTKLLNTAYAGRLNTWDYQWYFARFAQGMLSIAPSVNLVENIGFDGSGTNCGPGEGSPLRCSPIAFPLRHPEFVVPAHEFDASYARHAVSALSRGDEPIRAFARKIKHTLVTNAFH